MESKTLVFILLGVFIVLTIVVLFSPGKNIKEVSNVFVGENIPSTCKEKCNGNEQCFEQCKTALLNQASLSGDISLCDNFNGDEKGLCLDKLKMDKALHDNKLDECNGLTKEAQCKDAILYNQYLKTKDKSICDKIVDVAARQSCLSS